MIQCELQECLNWNCSITKTLGWLDPQQMAFLLIFLFGFGIFLGFTIYKLLKKLK